MIIDSSALVAVILREPVAPRLVHAMAAARSRGVGAPTMVESGIVLYARLGPAGKTLLARLVDETGTRVLPMTREHWGVAVDGFARFGKGRHAAGLNLGDCVSYAMAMVADDELLCVGDDFPRTDVRLAALP